eukprot:350855-Chlamydomonas_euryale.AAC.1
MAITGHMRTSSSPLVQATAMPALVWPSLTATSSLPFSRRLHPVNKRRRRMSGRRRGGGEQAGPGVARFEAQGGDAWQFTTSAVSWPRIVAWWNVCGTRKLPAPARLWLQIVCVAMEAAMVACGRNACVFSVYRASGHGSVQCWAQR